MSNPVGLTIRTAQMEVLAADLRQRFEDRLREDLVRYWPDACRELGDAGLRGRVREGVERAQAHGVSAQRDVLRFLNVVFALGPGFESDVRYPWAADILGAPGVPAAVRMDQLCAHVQQVLG
ncbi:hypothetical protein [Pyxidicoccus xibeiensis]|uniref:hypothetical protein n=1 Tax=Pyxidicoccus xibeiensis TaxID=2906759 RepID=UPI0020A6F309|nr:hypothetical protein [Pyxidicoccus xibeiensis]MCP3135804.1 hypothetical protein [Pyxidicoccus xibeiensis]